MTQVFTYTELPIFYFMYPIITSLSWVAFLAPPQRLHSTKSCHLPKLTKIIRNHIDKNSMENKNAIKNPSKIKFEFPETCRIHRHSKKISDEDIDDGFNTTANVGQPNGHFYAIFTEKTVIFAKQVQTSCHSSSNIYLHWL